MSNLPKSLKAKAERYTTLSKNQKEEVLEKLYVEMCMSWGKIGELTQTYANRVRRDATKFGIKSRDKSAAQKVALQSGRHSHPTKNKGHSDESKLKISESVADAWDGMTEETRGVRRKDAKRRWDMKSPEEIKAFRQAAGDGVRLAAKEGSALEKFLLSELIRAGHKMEFHKEHWVVREKLQIDLFVTDLNVAIEVDGPSHFRDIWGRENLVKNKQRDAEKTGLLLERGMCIIRVRQKQSLSQRYKREILAKVVESLDSIKTKFPERGERHIILGDD